MGRAPKARQVILDAARRIVRESGAGKLTFDELVQESGVTRGGITYHFATKDALLRALVESDIEQWYELEERHRPDCANDRTAELIAYTRGHTERNEDRRRFVTGMLSAVTLDHSLLDPVREFMERRRADIEWDDCQLRQQLLRLASEGLFWSEIFGCGQLQPDVRKRLVALMERLAEEWTAEAVTEQ
jgi:AcrR family transcriptional regulator